MVNELKSKLALGLLVGTLPIQFRIQSEEKTRHFIRQVAWGSSWSQLQPVVLFENYGQDEGDARGRKCFALYFFRCSISKFICIRSVWFLIPWYFC